MIFKIKFDIEHKLELETETEIKIQRPTKIKVEIVWKAQTQCRVDLPGQEFEVLSSPQTH